MLPKEIVIEPIKTREAKIIYTRLEPEVNMAVSIKNGKIKIIPKVIIFELYF